MKKITMIITAMVLLAVISLNNQSFAVKHTVVVANFSFTPSSLNVSVGDTIRWVWSSGTHTTTSGVIPVGAASWDHPITSTNTSYEYPVTVEGTYNYVCTPHASMGMTATFTAAGSAPTLAVSPANRSVSATSGTTTFTVTSNSSWTSSSNSVWCAVTTGGTGNGTISCNYTSNTTVDQRVATITVMVSGLPDQTVTVTQAGVAPTLTVSPSNQEVQATAGTSPFAVVSNTNWTTSSNAAWCTVTPSGTGNGTITATFEANSTNSIRVATITTTVSGLSPQTVTVTQAVSTVGVDEQAANTIQVYPNPSNGIFKLKAGSSKDNTSEVNVMDVTGKSIISGIYPGATECTFDLSSQPKGYYFVQVKNGGKSTVVRLILAN